MRDTKEHNQNTGGLNERRPVSGAADIPGTVITGATYERINPVAELRQR